MLHLPVEKLNVVGRQWPYSGDFAACRALLVLSGIDFA
jgi:hypothetical protein